ncbi:IrrE N-terminal-like domain containing protein [uncultured Caudovirales phage]|uniref:IrrE N-terminal-like domain containing protein n=1 Tax=uncultured Caudovirales phage TaxID=2100421 RepID=A0A6J5L7Z3_9CAUD|nr:IrrE N-terminal-like domain containing protein [uncultured Caudovirales phage]CAB5219331.1 IrrE N-terminal-like domain containing protein [uncultured Caudovirales phage]
MLLPKTIKLGTQDWTIVEHTSKEDGMLYEDNYGYTLERRNMIVVDKDASDTRKRQVVMHEILHAIRFTFFTGNKMASKLSFEDTEHYFIGMYEETLLMVLKDNPELVAYLTGKE